MSREKSREVIWFCVAMFGLALAALGLILLAAECSAAGCATDTAGYFTVLLGSGIAIALIGVSSAREAS